MDPYRLDRYGSLWVPSASSSILSLRLHLVDYDSFLMGPYGSSWILLDPYACLWILRNFQGVVGFVWMLIDPCGSLWIVMDSYESLWILWVLFYPPGFILMDGSLWIMLMDPYGHRSLWI